MSEVETSTLSDFLLQRIAEDEAAVVSMECHCPDEVVTGTPSDRWPGCPDRVLAECEAKRRIVAFVNGWQHETVEDCWYSCAATYGTDVEDACCADGRGPECDCGLDYRVTGILAPLALAYADHPDFQEAWRA